MKKGFTLIELLVVIAIIATFFVLIIGAVSDAEKSVGDEAGGNQKETISDYCQKWNC